MREFQINSNEAGQRFDKYLKKLLCNASGSFVYKMLRKKNIVLNGKKADGTEKLQPGDMVKLFLSDETFDKFSGSQQATTEYARLKQLAGELEKKQELLEVVYEDTDVIILNKPSGILSQKVKQDDISANERMLAYLIKKGELTEEMLHTFKPSICNRLDRNTSGLLTAGKTLKGLQELSSALKERSVRKYYRCIVKGEIRETRYIKGWLIKDERVNKVIILKEKPLDADVSIAKTTAPGNEERAMTAANETAQEIETEYRPVTICNGYTELEVHLITGRSHQIRAHLASVGHPIIGDYKYGNRKENDIFKREVGIDSQLLHAYRMEFADGREVSAPCPETFEAAWNYIREHSGMAKLRGTKQG